MRETCVRQARLSRVSSKGGVGWVPSGDEGGLSGRLDSEVSVEALDEGDGDIEMGDGLRVGHKDDFRGGKRGFRVGV